MRTPRVGEPAFRTPTGDYQGGILALSMQKDRDGEHVDKDEGLGVRAYFVVEGAIGTPSLGLRQIDGATGRAKIEGSKEVSGGIDIKHGSPGGPIDPADANGPDHVDEIVFMDFNPGEADIDADSFVIRFTKFKPGDDALTLTLTLADDTLITLPGISAFDPALFSDQGDDVWDLSFSGINTYLGSAALSDDDILKQVTIRAIERADESKTHFLINGFMGDVTIPEPAAIALLAIGGMIVAARRRRRQ